MATETRIKRVTKEELGKTIDSLGENLKQVIPAKDISDNCSYTLTYSYTLPTMTYAQPGEDDDLFDKNLDELQDLTISNNVISGDLLWVDDYEAFGGASGHFFAMKATSSSGVVNVIAVTSNGSKEFKIYDSEDSTNYDGVFILQILNDNLEKIVVRYLDGDEETVSEYKCDFDYIYKLKIKNSSPAKWDSDVLDVTDYKSLTIQSATTSRFQYRLDEGTTEDVGSGDLPLTIDVSNCRKLQGRTGGDNYIYYTVEK